jgi:hypothetical protein
LHGVEGDSSPASRTTPCSLHSTVPVPLPAVLWLSIALVAVSQVMILRSTVRAMRAAESAQARRGIEWAYAVGPAIVLALVLLATWEASQVHTTRVELEAKASQTSAP